MKPAKVLALLLAAILLLSACTAEPPAQETDGALAVTESTAPSTEPVTEPPPTTSPTEPTHDWTGEPYTSEEKEHYDSLRLPFDEALTFYIEHSDSPVVWKFSIAPSGTEDWTELTCTGYCDARDPHSVYVYRQYQIPCDAPTDHTGKPYRFKIEVDMDNEWNIERGFEYYCEIVEDILITDDFSVLIHRRSAYGEYVWVEDYMPSFFCDYCYDRFGITDPPRRFI